MNGRVLFPPMFPKTVMQEGNHSGDIVRVVTVIDKRIVNVEGKCLWNAATVDRFNPIGKTRIIGKCFPKLKEARFFLIECVSANKPKDAAS